MFFFRVNYHFFASLVCPFWDAFSFSVLCFARICVIIFLFVFCVSQASTFCSLQFFQDNIISACILYLNLSYKSERLFVCAVCLCTDECSVVPALRLYQSDFVSIITYYIICYLLILHQVLFHVLHCLSILLIAQCLSSVCHSALSGWVFLQVFMLAYLRFFVFLFWPTFYVSKELVFKKSLTVVLSEIL